VALREQDVLRLHIAVDQPRAVGVVQRFSGLPHQAHGVLQGERAFAIEPVTQGLAIHVGHHVIRSGRRLVGGTRVEQGEDMGMLEPRQDSDLKQEAIGAHAGDDLGVQDLDRYRAIVLLIPRQIHHRHPAPAQLPVDGVAVADGDGLEDGSPPRRGVC